MLKKQSRFRPTSLLVGVSLCVSSIVVAPGAAAAAACQAGQPGCVLPVGSAPPAPAPMPVQSTPAPVYVDEEGGGGIGILPILLGLAALAAVYFLFIDDNDGPNSP